MLSAFCFVSVKDVYSLPPFTSYLDGQRTCCHLRPTCWHMHPFHHSEIHKVWIPVVTSRHQNMYEIISCVLKRFVKFGSGRKKTHHGCVAQAPCLFIWSSADVVRFILDVNKSSVYQTPGGNLVCLDETQVLLANSPGMSTAWLSCWVSVFLSNIVFGTHLTVFLIFCLQGSCPSKPTFFFFFGKDLAAGLRGLDRSGPSVGTLLF